MKDLDSPTREGTHGEKEKVVKVAEHKYTIPHEVVESVKEVNAGETRSIYHSLLSIKLEYHTNDAKKTPFWVKVGKDGTLADSTPEDREGQKTSESKETNTSVTESLRDEIVVVAA